MAQNTAPNGRKSGRKFASFRATFSRSATPTVEIHPKANEDVPPNTPTLQPTSSLYVQPKSTPTVGKLQPPATKSLEKRQSKLNLFDLFSKPKVEQARGYHESASVDILPERSRTPAHFYRRQELPQSTQPRAPSRSASRLDLRIEKPSIPTLSKPIRPSDDWDPPPLFQAYPQSVKYGTLKGTNLSTETLLRAQHYRQNGMLPGAFGSATSLAAVSEGESTGQEFKRHGSRRFSTLSEATELVEKVFVLVTTGRLVQYAGDGNYDRMPEKVLQLGEKSAAFACDLIPGKHWVVQVVQSANEDGVATVNKSRSLLSRLRMPTSAARRTTSSFLLVFSSAEDMDGWLRAIRKLIDHLNGKNSGPGEARHSRQNSTEKPTENVVSHRYRVQRPPSVVYSVGSRTRSSSSHSHAQSPTESGSTLQLPTVADVTAPSSPVESPRKSPQLPSTEEDGSSKARKRVASEETPSITTTAPSSSSDQARLDQLREGSRQSFISNRTSRTSETETVTVATSRSSSSPSSPLVERFPEQPEPAPEPVRIAPIRSSYINPSTAYNSRRKSNQPVPINHAQSTFVQTERITGVTTGPTIDMSDRFYLTMPTPLPSTIPEYPWSRQSQTDDGPQTRTLKALGSESALSSGPDESKLIRRESTRRRSTIGQLPNLSNRSASRSDQPRTRPFFRPLPVRPSQAGPQMNRTSQSFQLRRFSSLPEKAVSTAPAVQPVSGSSHRYSSVPAQSPMSPWHNAIGPPAQPVNRAATRFSVIPTPPSTAQQAPTDAPQVHLMNRATTRFSVIPTPPLTTTPSPAITPQDQPVNRAATRFSIGPTAPAPGPPSPAIAPAVQPVTKAATRLSISTTPPTAARSAPADGPPQNISRPSSRFSSTPSLSTTTTSVAPTTRPRAPSYSLIPVIQPTPQPAPPVQQTLRRPTSMQIRSDPAPFLSSRRTSNSYRSSSAQHAPTIFEMKLDGSSPKVQTSIPMVILPGLPPPAPPPNLPLPPPPGQLA